MIIVAIDEISLFKASEILNNLDPRKCMVKIGSVSFNSIGQEIIYYAAEKGFDIFLDLKLHDIPNTVRKSIEGLKSLPIKMLTIHISGGKDMMEAAMDAVTGTDIKIFGVTALTSLSNADTNEIFQRTTLEQVNAMLDLAESVGIDGVVCSPHELELVSKRESLLSITPGIRLKDSNDDQKRVMIPKEAIDLGANYLVIGRPITQSDDMLGTLEDIFNKIYNS
jgi:orotidine 5''-phosphate decarboxylase, subfamily 1